MCLCPPAPGYVMGADELSPFKGVQMAFQLNPQTGLCEPMCGNGATFDGFQGGDSTKPLCKCPIRDPCSQYAPPNYKRHMCNNNGKGTAPLWNTALFVCVIVCFDAWVFEFQLLKIESKSRSDLCAQAPSVVCLCDYQLYEFRV
jgi:hypothetical protein